MRTRLFRIPFATFIILSLLLVAATPVMAAPKGTVDVQILAINDFHGVLEPLTGSSSYRVGTKDAGGAIYLATYLKTLEATNPDNTLIVAAGDSIGGSPLISGLFHDEPTIEALNLMGFDYSTVGNHEFDEGYVELQRMANGGCHPTDGCLDGDDFYGADFEYLSSNVILDENGKTLFQPYKIRSFAGAKVAILGVALESTPSIVTASGVAGVSFEDEIDTINKYVDEITAKGVKTIIVLLHDGGTAPSLKETTLNSCDALTSNASLASILAGMSPEVDVVITGHSHNAYNCTIDGKLVTSAASNGRLITDIDLTIDKTTGDVSTKAANNIIVTRDVTPDPDMTALLAKYQTIAAPMANEVIGYITTDLTKTANNAGESPLGDVIADAQLAYTALEVNYNPVIAFMNPGGIRVDLDADQSSGGEPYGAVTYGEAFAVQPFGNDLVTMTLKGEYIYLVLEQQWPANRVLQISTGFTYTYYTNGTVGSKIVPGSVKLYDVPIDPEQYYRITVNSFLAGGGDGFTAFTHGTDIIGGGVDLDALKAYFAANSPVSPNFDPVLHPDQTFRISTALLPAP